MSKITFADDTVELVKSAYATKAYGDVSPHYLHIPTVDLIEAFSKKGWNVASSSERHVRKDNKRDGHQKHLVVMEHPKMGFSKEGNMNLCIRNSSDRTNSIEIFMGFMRIACSNQLMVSSLGNGFHFKFRHNQNKQEAIKEAVKILSSGFETFRDEISFLMAKELTAKKVRVFAQEAINYRFGAASPQAGLITPEMVLEVRRSEDAGNSAWKVLNRVQENLVTGGGSYVDNKSKRTNKTIRRLKSVDRLPKFNSYLWQTVREI